MKEARKLGNFIEQLAASKGLSTSQLGSILGCSENRVLALIKGRAYATFAQISSLASALGVSVQELLRGDEQHYQATVVHCMNEFQDQENREMILDLIDHYVDVIDAVKTH